MAAIEAVPMERDELGVFVGPGVYCEKENAMLYKAVDYQGQRFHIGEHVAVKADEGAREWVLQIVHFIRHSEKRELSFRGRWFWTPDQVREEIARTKHRGANSRVRKVHFESSELIISDLEDINPVDCINRKCAVLRRQNFEFAKASMSRSREPWRHFYFCDRGFASKTCSVFSLSMINFPGDPVPSQVLSEMGYDDNDMGMPRDCRKATPYMLSVLPEDSLQAMEAEPAEAEAEEVQPKVLRSQNRTKSLDNADKLLKKKKDVHKGEDLHPCAVFLV